MGGAAPLGSLWCYNGSAGGRGGASLPLCALPLFRVDLFRAVQGRGGGAGSLDQVPLPSQLGNLLLRLINTLSPPLPFNTPCAASLLCVSVCVCERVCEHMRHTNRIHILQIMPRPIVRKRSGSSISVTDFTDIIK